jgi:Protein of unknown function (DUF732)
MDIERITRPLRLAKGSHQTGTGKGCANNVISHINGHGGARRVGIAGMAVLAAMALGADPVANADTSGFFGAAQAAGVTGLGPAMLENGYDVCWKIWNGGYTGQAAAAALRQTYPTLTAGQADQFVRAAYQNLCPTQGAPGAYDWWAYSNGSG